MKIICILLLCLCSLNIAIIDDNAKFYEIIYKRYKNFTIDLTLNNDYDFGKNFTVIMKFL